MKTAKRYGRRDPARTVHRIVTRELSRCAARYARGDLVDIGCGEKPRAALFDPYVTSHVGVDHEDSLHDISEVEIRSSAYEIPVPNGSFDTVLCTAVLEHLEDPAAAIREAYRVLRPDGIAIYTVPLFWHIHEEPRDFFRYTRYGLEHLFRSAGFKVLEVKPLSGFLITFATELGYYIQRFRRGILAAFVDLLVVMLNWAAPKLDRGVLRADEFTWMYLVVARR